MDKDEAEVVALLRETVRQQRMWLVVVAVGAVVVAIAVIALVPGARLGAPLALAGVGVFLGVLITAPQRRLLAELGLTREQAVALLSRADIAGRTPEQLRERQAQRRTMWRVVTAVTTIIAVIAIGYVVSQAGNRVDDNVPGSGPTALFGWALFASAVAGITAIVGFVQLSTFASLDRAMSGEGDEITS